MSTFQPPVMPSIPAPPGVGLYLLVTVLIGVSILAWWALSAERKRGPILPFLLIGTGLSAVAVESVFDNVILYWWPVDNPYAMFSSYGRDVPWSAVIGYAWYFSGAAYFLYRRFERGVTVRSAILLYLLVFAVDWFAMSIAEWTGQSGFYGHQPYHFFGTPLWFSFIDATGAFAIGAAVYALVPHLAGARKALLLVLPTYIYGGVLGFATPPIGQALNSGWSDTAIWLCGTASMLLCWLLVFVLSKMLAASSVARATRPLSPASTS